MNEHTVNNYTIPSLGLEITPSLPIIYYALSTFIQNPLQHYFKVGWKTDLQAGKITETEPISPPFPPDNL